MKDSQILRKLFALLLVNISATIGQRCNEDTEFACANGNCTSKFYICDWDDDCGDLSDENEEMCRTTPCYARYWKCEDFKCIFDRYRCDGYGDCRDSSDEKNCPCPSPEADWRRCDDGTCVKLIHWCDGIVEDCPDGSDEINCRKKTLHEMRN
ncbi:very low-density lipoprotein receptor-like [Folsomia candida]|uniref:very low-density lipoprotein receptor-like n=1 Tax=Folsomia candida TaxID=158441 RepID=UPI001604BF4A|nr:very low-density lipoprotein receptor-like [Folsomia candida]